ncbi:hypothetical protein [Zunongwangia atlantica]|uniref:Outer membrane protein n=1 Tax=Zunongwangia atlantica 22II14-10F7 TaxID=1185767 RepID=A0A1Y1T0P0_9FLAO|nr:hypothetical protein [Zunongwangia atlantica]ORL44586.1 hypothetical protein IIF7_15143 [Zunongwangia atlantica 22II14-10F7]
MIRRFIVIVALFSAFWAKAQENTSSPYSYYGVGITNFKGTVENRAMGGLSTFSDSIHMNLTNPAGFGKLARTTYTAAASVESTQQETSEASDRTSNVSLDYLGLGVPVGRFGFGAGLIPYSSVGYRIIDVEEDGASRLQGRGGMNKVFLSAAYAISRDLSIGVNADYNFGNIQHRRTVLRDGIQYGTRDIDRSDISGFNFNFGLDYQTKLKNGLKLHASAVYTPEADITTESYRELSNVLFTANGEDVYNVRNFDIESQDITLPSKTTFGLGLGRPNKWFVGAEYSAFGSIPEISVFSTPVNDAEYNDGSAYRLGGYIVPEYSSLTSYFKRVVYRFGGRFEETGLQLNGESIDEFGISFGFGLPIGGDFSNLNLGLEYGQRGTTSSGLIQENFFKLSIGLSLNDQWFVKRKFN